MGELRKSASVAWAVALALALLLAGYVGAYYATVRPLAYPEIGRQPVYRFWPGRRSDAFKRDRLARLFRTIHRLDRLIRPHVGGP